MAGKLARGVVHGRTIELSEDLGLAEGQEIEVRVEVVPSPRITPTPRLWGEGLRRCAGAFTADWTEEGDRVLEEIHQDRKRDVVDKIDFGGLR